MPFSFSGEDSRRQDKEPEVSLLNLAKNTRLQFYDFRFSGLDRQA
jgi:hypothetical protein